MTKKQILIISLFFLLALLITLLPLMFKQGSPATYDTSDIIKLPEPRHESTVSVEQALLNRRSVRDYKDEPLSLFEISQLLWAAQGETDKWGHRTAPSAGALYPLELYLVVGEVEALAKGVYKYVPQEHGLVKVADGDKRGELVEATYGQTFIKKGAVIIVISAVYERTTNKYKERGIRYVHLEAGHAAQNLYLQSISLGLGTVTVGAFNDDEVRTVLNMKEEEQPLYIMPVGRKK